MIFAFFIRTVPFSSDTDLRLFAMECVFSGGRSGWWIMENWKWMKVTKIKFSPFRDLNQEKPVRLWNQQTRYKYSLEGVYIGFEQIELLK